MNNDTLENEEIDVSFVMSVYNKEYYLPSVLDALLNQTGLKNPEFIFIDDVSKDKSVEILREKTKNIKNVVIVAKEVNDGISITVNQGIKLARGKWVRMLDSDDILPLDSTIKMIELANLHNADMVYGKFTKTGKEPWLISNEVMDENFSYKYFPDAMQAVLGGHFIRMGQLIKREILQKAGGADERVFIQDETIPLRVGRLANGAIRMFSNVILVPKETNNLSKNTVQLDNDRFFANYYMLKDFQEVLRPKDVLKLYERAISSNWKYVKKNIKNPYLTWDFGYYLLVKTFKLNPCFEHLDKIAKRFLSLEGILRSKKQDKNI
ncbi:MAG: glycosyltransferase family 2 protein [Alphaproteobacteria bacterium]|nr:glycosyltransferase family 2 protein [Alphaproteobacteria bacterium]